MNFDKPNCVKKCKYWNGNGWEGRAITLYHKLPDEVEKFMTRV